MFFSAALPPVLLFSTKPWLAAANGRDQQPSAPSLGNTIYNDQNLRYIATVIVGGQSINVTLDTGSTDMWLNPRGGVGTFQDTGVSHEIHYGDGSPFINGTIGLIQVSLAGHVIPKQAFINITQISGLDQCGHGDCGLIGLGFDNPKVGIQHALKQAGQDGTTIGKSVLSNIFDMNPDKGRFFALSLSRERDARDSAPATLHISEYATRYESVQYEPIRPVYPPTETNWNLLSKGFSVNGRPLSLVANDKTVPGGNILIGLDTGNPGVCTQPEIREAIYSQIPGAVLSKNSSIPSRNFRVDQDIWVVPCNASLNLTMDFEGSSYPVHPLDLTAMYTHVGRDGVNRTICVNTITNCGMAKDVLYGDPFLRNVYTVYNFGNATTPPFVQFSSQTDVEEAATDFAIVRQELLAGSAPELGPADLVHLYDGPSAGIPANPTSPGSSCSSDVRVAKNLANDATPSSDDSILAKHAPVTIGLLAANLLIVLSILALAVVRLIRDSREVGSARSQSAPRYVPVHVRDDDSAPLTHPPFSDKKGYSDA